MSDRTDHYVPDKSGYEPGAKLIAKDATERIYVIEYVEGVGRTLVERHIAFGLADEHSYLIVFAK